MIHVMCNVAVGCIPGQSYREHCSVEILPKHPVRAEESAILSEHGEDFASSGELEDCVPESTVSYQLISVVASAAP